MAGILPYGTVVYVKEGFFRGNIGVIDDVRYYEDKVTPKEYHILVRKPEIRERLQWVAVHMVRPLNFLERLRESRK